jgi:MFS family permease
MSTEPAKHHIHEQDTHEFPDSGLAAWSVIFGCCFVSFMTFGMINSYAVFQTHYETVLFPHVSSWKLSIIGASQASGIYLFTPLAIPLHHALGIRHVLALGGTFIVVGFLGLSSVNEKNGELWKCYLFQAVMFPIGGGLLFPPVMLSPIEWFNKNRALALGVSQCGVGLGGMIWPIVFKNVVEKHGFRWGVRTIGLMYIPLSLGAVLFIPRKLDERYISPGQKPLSNTQFSWKNIKVLHWTYLNTFRRWTRVVKDMKYVALLVVNLIGMFGSYPAIFYIDYYASIIFGEKDPTSNLVKWIIVIYNIMGTPGRIIPAFIADKVGRTNVLISCILASGALILSFWISSIQYELTSLFVVFAVLFGFTIGPFFSLFPACITQIFGSKDSDARIGLFLIISTPGPILGCIISGNFIEKGAQFDVLLDSFTKLCLYSGIMLVCSSLVLVGVRLSITRKLFVFV